MEELKKRAKKDLSDFEEVVKISFISKIDDLKFYGVKNYHASRCFFYKKQFLESVSILVSEKKLKIFKKIKKDVLLNNFLECYCHYKNGFPVTVYYYDIEKIIKINLNDLKKLVD